MSTNAEILKKGYQFFNEGNIPALMELYTDDIEYNIMGVPDIPWAGTYKGKQEILGFIQKLAKHVEFTKFEIKEMITEGNKACVLVDAGMRMKSNNQTIYSTIAHWITLKNGKVNGLSDFGDTAMTLNALKGRIVKMDAPNVN